MMIFSISRLLSSALTTVLLFVFLVSQGHAGIQIPVASDWTDRGTVINAGNGWDKRLGGAISPSTVIKKNGTIFLYYIGADGNRSSDGGPRHRALGVATSQDGINFTKYNGNPVITHLPHNNEEEGVFSAAATLDTNGDVVLYYGALWAKNSTTGSVDDFITLATSTDGFIFNNRGANGEYVYQISGGETQPLGVTQYNGTWYVYYVNNSGAKFNLLTGPSMDNLSRLGSVSGTGGIAKGGGDPIFLDNTNFVSFINHFNTRDPLVVIGSIEDPQNLTQVDRYNNWGGSTYKISTTYLDKDLRTWFMYYGNKVSNTIGVKTAPLIEDGNDNVPPKEPSNVRAE